MSESRLQALQGALTSWHEILQKKQVRLRSYQRELVELRRLRVRPHAMCTLLLHFCATLRQERALGQEAIRCCEERIQRLHTEMNRDVRGGAA